MTYICLNIYIICIIKKPNKKFERERDFQRAVTLLLVKIFLNLKNGEKAMSKLFLKPLINFFVQ